MSSQGRRLVVEADGGSRGNPGPAGYGAVVLDARTREVLAERGDFLGVATNNVAEYSGLVAGLEAARAIDPEAEVEVRMDSRLVVEQMAGRWRVKHADMQRLADQARAVLPVGQVTYTWIPRSENAVADALANEAMDLRAVVVRDHGPSTGHDDTGSRADGPPAQDEPGRAARPALRERRPSGSAMRFDDTEPVTVVLIRHGETTLTRSKALSGSSVPGPPLAAAGRVQAARAADLTFRIGRSIFTDLPHPGVLLASPMVRTQETAGAVARRLGLPVALAEAFAESDFGDWEGLSVEAVEDGWPGHLRRWYEEPSVTAPGGESLEDVGRRVRAGLQELVDGGVDRTVVVVSHAMAIRAAIGVTLGIPATAWCWLRVLPASVSVLRWWPDGTREAVVIGLPTEA
ncbi:bifunctional RNase H/acid phosphatase [Actinotalea sp. K2]|uniref:bifunctional RNase H/acid phosphatase n=1 Tax=Actinotalea sp. K2 TaxID=2939438 RepID=UPI002017CC76|nr:bifunctional RNase H/acid phosphatase [Actinotalea sp. K2]MCL3860679.1 bifunctional RNase H/acid phosphatase [Actinotalea sp. K2]